MHYIALIFCKKDAAAIMWQHQIMIYVKIDLL